MSRLRRCLKHVKPISSPLQLLRIRFLNPATPAGHTSDDVIFAEVQGVTSK